MLPEGDLRDTKVLAALLGISEMVAGLTDLEEVLGAIVRITPQLVGVDRCAILLFDPQRHEFRTAQMFGPDRERNAIFQRLVLREDDVRNLAHRILEQKLPALVRGASLPPHMADSLGMRTVLIVPVVCRDTVLGIMLLDHTKGPRLLTSQEINVVMGVAQQAAIAIDNFRLKAETARAEEKLRVTSEILADGLITLTEDHRIAALDGLAEELLQWQTAEVAGRGFAETFGVTDRGGVRLPDAPRAADLVLRPAVRREPTIFYLRRKDGSRVLCEVRTAEVRDDLGGVLDVVCALRRVPSPEGTVDGALDNPVPRRVVKVGPLG
ncbi:MAG: GAF domain-containing protein [Methanobacteriota archaeon]|nr:MAG: GAF domain-containing protein [Euryarchaeota archaeon]